MEAKMQFGHQRLKVRCCRIMKMAISEDDCDCYEKVVQEDNFTITPKSFGLVK